MFKDNIKNIVQLFALTLVSNQVAAFPTYKITDFRHLGNGSLHSVTSVFDFNDNGQFVGYYRDQNLKMKAFLYDGSQLKDLAVLGFQKVHAINNNGQVVGEGITGSGKATALLFDGSTVKNLGNLGGSYAGAYDINNKGQVVGVANNSIGVPHAFLYDGKGMVDLGAWDDDLPDRPEVEAGNSSSAQSINDLGQIVGHGFWGQGDTQAMSFDGDIVTLIRTSHPGELSRATAINNKGHIVGSSGEIWEQHAFFNDDISSTDLGTLGTAFQENWSFARDLNDNDQIVGITTSEERDAQTAFFWEQGSDMVFLDKLIDQNDPLFGIQLDTVSGINELGQIVAKGGGKLYLLTPVPLPGSLLFFSTGMVSLLRLGVRPK